MKIVAIPKYSTPYGVIEFVPVTDMPGYTHRIHFEGKRTPHWLSRGKSPGVPSAEFFTRVLQAEKSGLPKYHYADRREDPPLPQPGPP